LEVKLLKMLMALPLKRIQPTLSSGHCFRQAMGILLGHLSSLARLRKLALKEGDLSNKAFSIFMSRG
jgi:hypothetical protein